MIELKHLAEASRDVFELSRAYEMSSSNKLKDIVIDNKRREARCSALGSGEDPYFVVVHFEAEDGLLFSECNCPSHRFSSNGSCKHALALTIVLLEENKRFNAKKLGVDFELACAIDSFSSKEIKPVLYNLAKVNKAARKFVLSA